MLRSEVEKYLGKKVKVTMIVQLRHQVWIGELHKTGEEQFKNNANLYIPKNYYFCVPQSHLFRCSHILKIEEIK